MDLLCPHIQVSMLIAHQLNSKRTIQFLGGYMACQQFFQIQVQLDQIVQQTINSIKTFILKFT
jgi:ribosomal 50S subunit-associated protein YjgA (DUF615 family)